ncbi:MAG: hypothetical protein VB110_09020 [Bacteroidales bacterium]|nr:hypothetical protein [Bacteroidales bacterium]
MRQNLIFLILLIGNTLACIGQGMSKFEIWGWNGSIQEFAKIYKDKTDIDLNNGYCCVAELQKMGYKHAVSDIYVDNIDDYLSGKRNWDLIERVTIIRQVSENKYTKIAADTLCQDLIAKLLLDIEKKDSLSINQFFIENPSLFDEVLIGTLAVNNQSQLRNNCCNLISKRLEISTFRFSNTELEILSSMLSFPDPLTCYCAFKTISKTTIENKKILFNDGAETIKDFLKSNLQSYKADAINFLTALEPNRENYSCEEWIKWIDDRQ